MVLEGALINVESVLGSVTAMQEQLETKSESQLKRTLGLRDVVLLNVSCIVGLSSLAQVAQFGFASISLYALAVFTFLIPCGVMVAELNARMPEEGGFYLWTRNAFGDVHGYIAAWSYWLCNIVWMPAGLLFVSLSCLYLFGDTYLHLGADPVYVGCVSLGTLWLVTALNIFGLQRAKWIQNIGGLATWMAIVLLLVVGGMYVMRFGSAHEFSTQKLLPDFTNLAILPFFAMVAFSFGGLELAPVMAGEIQNPKRTIPRAIGISSIIIGLLYILGTLMLVFTVGEDEVGIIEGVVQAFFAVSSAFEVPALRIVGTLLVALGALGLFASWLTGNARIPYVIGLEDYLPKAFATVHPRWGSPHISLIAQAVVITLLLLASLFGSTIKDAYMVVLDMSIILYFIPFLYMFAAFAWHLRRDTGASGIFRTLKRSSWTVWLIAFLGFGTTIFSLVISTVPSGDIENKPLFVLKVVGGAALLIGLGLVAYWRKQIRAH